MTPGRTSSICPRVTDASLVTGPAAWWHGWRREDFDRLAGAVAAGHVIECGPQATGGNYSYLHEVTDRRYPGFPVAEVAHDGSSVITKHDGTGGLVSIGTVTAQLLYEIGEPAYLNPDVVAHFDTITLEQLPGHRVRLSGTVGTPPPDTLKVCVNFAGGYRNTMTLVITGLDIEEKAAWAAEELFGILGGRGQFDDVDIRLLRFDHPDAPVNEQATAHLRVTVKDRDPRKVGRRFSNATMELALGGYAGFHTTTPPTAESAYGVYWPALVPAAEVEHAVVLPDGTRVAVPATRAAAELGWGIKLSRGRTASRPPEPEGGGGPGDTGVRAPLGRVCAARSGDKGGNANVGLWARDAAGYRWLRDYLTTGRLRSLLPEAKGLEVCRLRAAEPARAELRDRRAARRGGGVLDAPRPAGEGARGVPALAAGDGARFPARWRGAVTGGGARPGAGPAAARSRAAPAHPRRRGRPGRGARVPRGRDVGHRGRGRHRRLRHLPAL